MNHSEKHTESGIHHAWAECHSYVDALVVFDGYMDGFIYENGEESYGRAYDIPQNVASYIRSALLMAINNEQLSDNKGGDEDGN